MNLDDIEDATKNTIVLETMKFDGFRFNRQLARRTTERLTLVTRVACFLASSFLSIRRGT